MAANTRVAGPNFAGIMRHAEARGNKSGSAPGMAKVPLKAVRIAGGSATTPSPTKSVVTPTQPSKGKLFPAGRGGVTPYNTLQTTRTPAGYKR